MEIGHSKAINLIFLYTKRIRGNLKFNNDKHVYFIHVLILF